MDLLDKKFSGKKICDTITNFCQFCYSEQDVGFQKFILNLHKTFLSKFSVKVKKLFYLNKPFAAFKNKMLS